MPPKQLSANPDLDEERADRKLFFAMIGSTPFKVVMGVAGAIFVALLTLGWKSYIQEIATEAPEIRDVQTKVTALVATVSEHTSTIKATETNQKEVAELQGKIFEAIKGVSKDVHDLEIHVAKVDQKVDDLKK